jgi:hypothetical protein
MAPKIYLISSKASEEQVERIKSALSLTPVDVVVATAPQLGDFCRKFSEDVTGLNRPIAIVADFEAPLTAINDDGSLEIIHV